MNEIIPFVRHMILCESAHRNPNNPKKIDVYGLLSTIRGESLAAAYPMVHTFTVYLILTSGRGDGQLQIIVTSADTDEKIYESPPYPIQFVTDPLKVFGVVIHVGACSFPQTGLYWVETWYNGKMLAHQPLEVA